MEPDLIPVEPTLAIFGVLAGIASIAVPAIVKAGARMLAVGAKPAAKIAATMAGGSKAARVAKGMGAVVLAGGSGLALDAALAPSVEVAARRPTLRVWIPSSKTLRRGSSR